MAGTMLGNYTDTKVAIAEPRYFISETADEIRVPPTDLAPGKRLS